MKKIIIQAVAIAFVSLIIALLYNELAVRTLPVFGKVTTKDAGKKTVIESEKSAESGGEEVKPPDYIDLEEAYRLFSTDGTLFVDARSYEEFTQGRIKKAVLLSYDEFDKYFNEISAQLDKATTLVVYCNGEECDLSIMLADELYFLGYGNVNIFHGGWNEWEDAGYPTEGKEGEK